MGLLLGGVGLEGSGVALDLRLQLRGGGLHRRLGSRGGFLGGSQLGLGGGQRVLGSLRGGLLGGERLGELVHVAAQLLRAGELILQLARLLRQLLLHLRRLDALLLDEGLEGSHLLLQRRRLARRGLAVAGPQRQLLDGALRLLHGRGLRGLQVRDPAAQRLVGRLRLGRAGLQARQRRLGGGCCLAGGRGGGVLLRHRCLRGGESALCGLQLLLHRGQLHRRRRLLLCQRRACGLQVGTHALQLGGELLHPRGLALLRGGAQCVQLRSHGGGGCLRFAGPRLRRVTGGPRVGELLRGGCEAGRHLVDAGVGDLGSLRGHVEVGAGGGELLLRGVRAVRLGCVAGLAGLVVALRRGGLLRGVGDVRGCGRGLDGRGGLGGLELGLQGLQLLLQLAVGVEGVLLLLVGGLQFLLQLVDAVQRLLHARVGVRKLRGLLGHLPLELAHRRGGGGVTCLGRGDA